MKPLLGHRFACHKISLPLILLVFCHDSAFSQANATLKFGNSYVNLTKKTVGSTVEPGDTLEIRTNIYANSSYGKIYSVRYYDNLPTHTDTISSEFLRLMNNEGATFRQYTLPSDDDPGTFIKVPAFPGDYHLPITICDPPYGLPPHPP